MSVLTYIKDVPLFSNINEAVEWGRSKGLLNYHAHKFKSVTGYMGGKNHKEALPYAGILNIAKKRKIGYKPSPRSKVVYIADGKRHEYVNGPDGNPPSDSEVNMGSSYNNIRTTPIEYSSTTGQSTTVSGGGDEGSRGGERGGY